MPRLFDNVHGDLLTRPCQVSLLPTFLKKTFCQGIQRNLSFMALASSFVTILVSSSLLISLMMETCFVHQGLCFLSQVPGFFAVVMLSFMQGGLGPDAASLLSWLLALFEWRGSCSWPFGTHSTFKVIILLPCAAARPLLDEGLERSLSARFIHWQGLASFRQCFCSATTQWCLPLVQFAWSLATPRLGLPTNP